MAGCLSVTIARDRCYEHSFLGAGLRPSTAVLSDGTTISLFVPRRPDPTRRPLLLLHGFGARAIWQWSSYLRPLLAVGFDLYVPDLLFFGESFTPSSDRSDAFQAKAVMAAMEANGVRRFGVVGVSYGGFVAYRMAELFPGAVERVALCCAGICLEERDLPTGMLAVNDIDSASDILLPQRPPELRKLVRLAFVRPPPLMPSCFLWDYIQVMCTNHAKEKVELLHALIKDRKVSNIPKIQQPTLIIWGDQDRVFPIELAYRLKSHLGDNAKFVIIKKAGHAVNLEKPKEMCKHIKAFFLDPSSEEDNERQFHSYAKEDTNSANGLLANPS